MPNEWYLATKYWLALILATTWKQGNSKAIWDTFEMFTFIKYIYSNQLNKCYSEIIAKVSKDKQTLQKKWSSDVLEHNSFKYIQ